MTTITARPATKRATYTQLLPKGAALLPETKTLLMAWVPGEDTRAFTQRVMEQDLLGKLTARRTRDIIKEVFAARFLTPADAAARHLRTLVVGGAPRQVYSDLVFYYACRRDALLLDFTTLYYWPAVQTGRTTVANQDVVNFISEAESDGRIPVPWSEGIRLRLAGTLLTALTDFGLLRVWKPGTRQIVSYRPSDGAVVYLAYRLHNAGVTDASLADEDDWRVFGLSPRDVWDRIDALSGERWFVLQRAAEVVRITWLHSRMEDAVNALARADV